MKKIKLPLQLLLLTIFLFATQTVYGLGGDSGSEKSVPLPEKNFQVTVIDSKGVETTAKRVSWNGKIYIQGRRGDALTTIPFEKISNIRINPNANSPQGSIGAEIELKSGRKINLSLESNTKCYGETDFGHFEIYVKDIQSIRFN